MGGYSSSDSSGSSISQAADTAQSRWSLQLSQLLGAIGQNQYNWAMNQYAHGQQITDQNINSFNRMQGDAEGLTNNLVSQYNNVFQPLMNKFISDAGSFNSEARQRFNMGQAESTAAQADKAGMDAAERNLQGFGINPNSGRYQDLELTGRIQDAAARAGAGTQASVNTADRGRQMELQAAQMGQNLPGMAVNAGNLSNASATGAQNSELGLLNTGANLTSSAANFFNAAGNANKYPPNNTVSKNQSTGHSVQTNPSPPDHGSNQGNQGNSRTQPNYHDGDRGKAWMPEHGVGKGGGPEWLKPPKQTGQDNGDWNNPDWWYNQQDQAGNPLTDPGVWDYLNQGNSDRSQGGGINTIDPWNQNQNGLDPDLGGASRNNGADQDWSGGTTQTGNTDQNLPPDPFSWNANRQNPNNGTDPWANAQTQNSWGQGNQSFDYGNNQWGGDLGQENNNYNPQDYMDQYGQGQTGQADWGAQGAGGEPQDTTDFTGSIGNSGDGSGGGSSGDYGDYGGYARGGSVQRGVLPTSGGPVPRSASPSQGRQTDDVPARLNAGEFVIPRDVTQHLGTQHFHKLIEKSRMARTGMRGPPARPQMKPAIQQRPTFTSRPMGA